MQRESRWILNKDANPKNARKKSKIMGNKTKRKYEQKWQEWEEKADFYEIDETSYNLLTY